MKTFVWIIGKPGGGKTTIGDCLLKLKEEIVHIFLWSAAKRNTT